MTKRRYFGLLLAILFAAANFINAGPAGADTQAKDFTKPVQYHVVTCKSPDELDCLESFGFVDASGAYVSASLTSETFATQGWTDGQANTIFPGNTVWQATVDNEVQTATVDVELESPTHVIFANVDGTPHPGGHLRIAVMSPNVLSQTVRLAVRTSFLKPQNMQLDAVHTHYLQEPIKGGNRWTFQGAGTLNSGYLGDISTPGHGDFSAQADWDYPNLTFSISHADADLSRGYWPAFCADKGYSVQTDNASAGGDPGWRADTQSLDFSIMSPHTRKNGQPDIGYFQYSAPMAYINCRWPDNALAYASGFTVSVIDESGEQFPQVSAAGITNGIFHLSVEGFHYSSPTIQVKAIQKSTETPSSPEQSSPSASPSPSQSKPVAAPVSASKSKTITCIRGKQTKKVTGVAPKCPSGYKKKA